MIFFFFGVKKKIYYNWVCIYTILVSKIYFSFLNFERKKKFILKLYRIFFFNSLETKIGMKKKSFFLIV